ncbi:hypothetical protein PoB_003052900 [Plakobranchus ocellatus]|uniref:Uncharacterized protein n=1 Tax=Plakobranchus ocellatus TaxID=259542 RepID=A0AAV4A8S1_9GAST|nr:hypothetical protein PoB_003052900 [Plakobranchus ocellatus]
MADIQQELQSIKDQLSLVTKILPVVAELKEAFDSYKDGQEDLETGSVADLPTPQPGPSGLEATLAQSPQPGAEDAASQPGTVDSLPEVDPIPQASTSSILPKHSAITALQHLTGAVKTGQIELNQEVADSVQKVLVHGLDQTTKSNLDADIKLPSNCDRLAVLGCNPEIYKQASTEVKAHDRELQNVQRTLLHGISAMAQVLSNASDNSSQSTQQLLAGALALCADASHQLDISRRKAF